MNDMTYNTAFQNDPEDLDWIAFQYVANELSEQDAASFEAQLADQQAAREALATATQLLAGLKSLETSPQGITAGPSQPVRSITLSKTRQWSLVSLAALLLIAVTFVLNQPTHKTTPATLAQTEPSQEDLEDVLNLWTESSEENGITVALAPDLEPIDLLDSPNSLAENHSIEIPDWLYTAVSLPEESVN